MSRRQFLPALRGRFGDWAYYSVLMTLNQVVEHVKYASEVHPQPDRSNLSKLIQRELSSGRSREIAQYLDDNEDRFFNSLVVAVYGGDPAWHEFEIKPSSQDIKVEELTETALYSIGYLSLTGEERLFALDGQHRVAGIRQALTQNREMGEEEISVLVVAHHNDPAGLRRTRKLFTTLNRTAKPVNKSEIIALDETDVVAISTRHLVEEHPFFNNGQVDVLKKQANLHPNNYDAFTTIINMYDTLQILFSYVKERLTAEQREHLRFVRPSDDEVDDYNAFARRYYEALAQAFPDLMEYFESKSPKVVLRQKRSLTNSHILFRPVGHIIFVELMRALKPALSFERALERISHLPTRMQEAPYSGVIWNPRNGTIVNRRWSLCRDLLLHMLGHYPNREALRLRYAEALERDNVRLPNRV